MTKAIFLLQRTTLRVCQAAWRFEMTLKD